MNENLRKLRWLFTRRRRDEELAEELAFHLEEEAGERGYNAARRDLGNLGLIQEDTRQVWGWTWVEQLMQDLRFAARTMLKNPAFTAMATLSLALGIGANTAIFSFMDALMLRWLPVGEGSWFTPVTPAGKEPAPDQTTRVLTVGADYLATMKIPLIAGRDIDDGDIARSAAVAVVNEKYVHVNFDGRMPLGQRVVINPRTGKPAIEFEIVGVTEDFRYGGLKEELPAVAFVPLNQLPFGRIGEMTYSLRTVGDPLAAVTAVRAIVRQADARVPVTHIETQTAMIEQTMTQEILFARLCSGFALLALAIACVGLYGTMSYTVARRTGEIGIRMALGAPRGRVVWMVMRQVAIMGAIGLAIGLPAAWVASRLVESFLYGVKADDPSSIAVSIAVAIAVFVAGYAPALRASRIDPVIALRSE